MTQNIKTQYRPLSMSAEEDPEKNPEVGFEQPARQRSVEKQVLTEQSTDVECRYRRQVLWHLISYIEIHKIARTVGHPLMLLKLLGLF